MNKLVGVAIDCVSGSLMLKRLAGIASGVFSILLPLQAVSQTLEDQFNRQNGQLKKDQWIHDCSHWDKAQYASLMDPFNSIEIDKIYEDKRVRIHPNGRVIQIEKGGSLLKALRDTKSNKCVGEFVERTGKLGLNRKLYSDGSGSEVLIKTIGPFLVSYYKGCVEWTCKGFVLRTIQGIELSKAAVIYEKCGKPESLSLSSDPVHVCIKSSISSLLKASGIN